MADVTVERTIAADRETLWGMVSDVTRMGEWSPETREGVWAKGATAPAVGARFRGRNKNGIRRWSTSCTVTECDPGEVFAFQVTTGPAKVAVWEYRFEPDGDATKVTERFTDQRPGWLKTAGKLATGVGDRTSHNRATMEATLAALDHAATGS